jgi:crotonobetainyl-CoA:carnitine CoA-transferase CaiB-like acyl-CoA transferase
MERAAIERAAGVGGLTLEAETDLTITGADPVYETPFHLGEGAAVALGLVGQAADRLWRMRGGRRQSLLVDVQHAAASLNSYQFLSVAHEPPPPRIPPSVTAIYACRDGRFVHLHGSFTGGPATLAELGLQPDADMDQIAAAMSGRDAWELEDRLAAQGLCGAVVRTNAEWREHPQGQWLAARPVVELVKIGETAPEPLPDGPRPLSGVRVLDLTRVLAGPTCARTLAEHGADVLHIASPNLPTIERFEMDTGHGKRQAHIDLNHAEQAEHLRELARDADVFSQGFRYGTLARRGVSPEQLAKLRPGIVYVTENCYGAGGPWAGRPGWEQLAQTVSGVAEVEGGGRPRLAPAALNDYTTGYFAAMGAMEALARRATEGGSWHVRVSLTRTSMWYYGLGLELDRSAASGLGEVPKYLESHDSDWGRLTHVSPPLRMSETPPHWALPAAKLGSGRPEWLARA